MGNAIKERATVICRHEGKVLFVRKARHKWNLPGGRIEANEAPPQAARREVAEEIGVLLQHLAYLAPLELYRTLHYVFETELLAGMPEAIQPLNEIDDYRWIAPEELDDFKVHKAIAHHSIRRLLLPMPPTSDLQGQLLAAADTPQGYALHLR